MNMKINQPGANNHAGYVQALGAFRSAEIFAKARHSAIPQ